MEEIIIGLDISTTCIGVSEYTLDGVLISLTHIKLETGKSVEESDRQLVKADLFKEYLEKYKTRNIVKVIVEDPLQGSDNVFTVNKLMRFNGICSYLIYQELGIRPHYITVRDVRASVCPELLTSNKKTGKAVLSFPKGVDKKLYLFNKVAKWYPEIEWLYTRNNTLKKENFDMTDAAVLALAYLLQNNRIKYSEIGVTNK
jgi:hypothetical protein